MLCQAPGAARRDHLVGACQPSEARKQPDRVGTVTVGICLEEHAPWPPWLTFWDIAGPRRDDSLSPYYLYWKPGISPSNNLTRG